MSLSGNRWKWFAALAGVLIALQLVPIERDNPPVESEMTAPPDVEAILQRSCHDCHSHETRWPWYAKVAPVSWYLAKEVADARSEFNLSTWNAYRLDKRERLLQDAVEKVEEGSMPPRSYLWLHRGARVSAEELEILREWVGARGG